MLREYLDKHGSSKQFGEMAVQPLQSTPQSKFEHSMRECKLKVKLLLRKNDSQAAELRLLKRDIEDKGIQLHDMKGWYALKGHERHSTSSSDSDNSVDPNMTYASIFDIS